MKKFNHRYRAIFYHYEMYRLLYNWNEVESCIKFDYIKDFPKVKDIKEHAKENNLKVWFCKIY